MMIRFVLAVALLLSSLPAYGQGTVAPVPLQQFFDNTGAVLTSGGICSFRAGTSTLATTYTTAALTIANTNPILFSNGRPSSGGWFLTPGESYKFELRDFVGVGVPTCGAGVGATIYTVDNISAVPGSATNLDVPGTAGVTIAAGQVVYLSDASGGLNAGQWYLADADLTYAGALPLIGVAPEAIVSGASGSIRLQGRITTSGLSPGADYYVSGTPGAVTATAPGYARLVGRAETATVLVVSGNPRSTPTTPRSPCGRLTLTTAVPVTTADVTAAGTVFYTPYGGCNTISMYDGAVWVQRSFTEVSIAVPAVATQAYDVFAFDSAGTLTLELTAWTNDTTRATALAIQNGVNVKTGALTRLYLGSFRTIAASQTDDNAGVCRCVFNYYHRVPRPLQLFEVTVSWPYTVSTWRQARATTTNKVAVMNGVAESPITLSIGVVVQNDTGGVGVGVGIGLDSTTAPASNQRVGTVQIFGANELVQVVSEYRAVVAVGYHTFNWLERSVATGITTWYSSAMPWGFGGPSGIMGVVEQ